MKERTSRNNNAEQIVDLTKPADDIIERKNALRILAQVAKRKKRFGELQLLFGSPATLTIRLRELEKLGLIKREMEIQEVNVGRRNPAIICYEATMKGMEIARVYEEFKKQLGLRLAEKHNYQGGPSAVS